MKQRIIPVLFFVLLSFLSACDWGKKPDCLIENADIPCLIGESRTVIQPKPSPGFDENEWYTNDHCFVTDRENNLHWFGINNPYPPEGKKLYRYHPFLGHSTSRDPMKAWTRLPFALDESKGTEYLGAPFVVWHEETNRWVMLLQTRFETRYGLEVCWSDNLSEWQRTHTPVLADTLWSSTRDPHIMKGRDSFYWIHVVSSGIGGRDNSQVIRVKTKDFEEFLNPEVIMEIKGVRTAVESPFLVERDGWWYLFCTYAHRRYEETIVVISDNPDHFDPGKNLITTLFGHASEIFSYNGKTYISSCGPEDRQSLNLHGVTMAELKWLRQTGK